MAGILIRPPHNSEWALLWLILKVGNPGFETALSLAHAYTPAWACIDAGNLAAFPVLPGVESLVIGADNDPAGIRAAEACAERWTQAGREVHIVMANTHTADINDLVRAAA